MDDVTAYARQLADSVSPRSLAVIKAQVWKTLFQDFDQALATADDEMTRSFEIRGLQGRRGALSREARAQVQRALKLARVSDVYCSTGVGRCVNQFSLCDS